MISLETKIIQGKNYCVIRSWDGYAKPEYFKQFKITEKEINFEKGRFKKMKYNKEIYLKPFQILTNSYHLEPIVEWLSNNISKSFYITIEENIELAWSIYITKQDASWFCLKWGEYIV